MRYGQTPAASGLARGRCRRHPTGIQRLGGFPARGRGAAPSLRGAAGVCGRETRPVRRSSRSRAKPTGASPMRCILAPPRDAKPCPHSIAGSSNRPRAARRGRSSPDFYRSGIRFPLNWRRPPPRGDDRVRQAPSAHAWARHAPRASETAFRCRVRPAPARTVLPSACSGSDRVAPPSPLTGRDVPSASRIVSVAMSTVLLQPSAPGATTWKPSKISSPAATSRSLPVTIHAAFPATANSTRWLSDSSRRFGRQR